MLLNLISCKTIIKHQLKIKSPKFKSDIELYAFLENHDVVNNSLYYFSDWNAMIKASKIKYSSIPDAYFFNKNGEYIAYQKSTEDCNAKVDDFINELELFADLRPIDDKVNIKDVLVLLANDKNENIVLNDITVLITWASYLGDVNKDKAFEWIKLIDNAKRKGVKVNYYLISYDLQKTWKLSSEEEKEIESLFKI